MFLASYSGKTDGAASHPRWLLGLKNNDVEIQIPLHQKAQISFLLLFRQATAAEKWRNEDYMDDSSIPGNPRDMEEEEQSLSSQDIDVEETLSVIPQRKSPPSKSSTLSLFSKNLFKKGKGKESPDDGNREEQTNEDQIRRYTVRDDAEDWR